MPDTPASTTRRDTEDRSLLVAHEDSSPQQHEENTPAPACPPMGDTPAPAPPTLDDAFLTLARALMLRATDHDTRSIAIRSEELVNTYADGNRWFAWQELVKLLGQWQILRGV